MFQNIQLQTKQEHDAEHIYAIIKMTGNSPKSREHFLAVKEALLKTFKFQMFDDPRKKKLFETP